MMMICPLMMMSKSMSKAQPCFLLQERRWFLLKIPRCDPNGVGEAERNDGVYSKYRDATKTEWGK